MTSITVNTTDLRAALQAVTPHADPSPEFPPLHRVRLVADSHNVWVTATNRYTAALAIVSVEDLESDEDNPVVDLWPNDVKEILTIHKPAKDEPDQEVRIDAYDKHTRITDVSGMFPGKALQLPKVPVEDNFPDIPQLIHDRINADPGETRKVITSGKLLGLFADAAKAYNQALVVEATGPKPALVVACGESFLGLLVPHTMSEDQDDEIEAWRSNWHTRLLNKGGITITRIPAQA